MTLGVADVHAGEVGGEQRGLLAALPRLDLEHDVVAVVRVARGEQVGQLGFEFVDRGLEIGDLGGEGLVVGAEFARGLQVAAGGLQLAVGRDDRRELREPSADLAGRAGVGVQIRVGELALEVGMLGKQRLDPRRACPSCRLLPANRALERKPTPGLRRTRQIGRR